ncbi:MAG: hypothetical protein HRT82_10660 [Henriciella sp.]|nr:hypothetical protein [Henriciella sp.]
MKIKIYAALAAVLAIAFGQSLSSASADRNAFIKAYNDNKSAAMSGIRPETRSEFAKCMMVWGFQALIIDDDPDYELSVDPEFTMEIADTIYQHWWGRAEAAYGPERFDRFAEDMITFTQAYYDEESFIPIYADLGACYVAPEDRNPADRLTAMAVMPSNGTAAVPLGLLQRHAGVEETALAFIVPEMDMLDKIVDGTISVDKKRRFRGLQRVAIPHFAVSFGFADSAQTRARSSQVYGAGTQISASAELVNLKDPVLQSLTDFAYNDFVEKMMADGFIVRSGPESQQQLLRNPLRNSKVYDQPVRDMSVYHNAFNPNFKDITYAPQGMNLIHPLWEASMATKNMDIPALNVQYAVHFAWFDGTSSSDKRAFSGNESMTSSMGTNLNVQVIYSSGVEMLGDTAQNPKFSVEGTFYSEEPYWADYNVNNSGGGSRKRMDVSVIALDWAYYYEAMKVIARTNTALVSQLAAAR